MLNEIEKENESNVVDSFVAVISAPCVVEPSKAEHAVAAANTLRLAAEEYHDIFEVEIVGRMRLLHIMCDVYDLYHAIATDEDDENLVHSVTVATMKAVLKRENIKIREKSDSAIVLTRYIFKKYSDKQVSVYSTCLRHAFLKKVVPSEFGVYVSANGGFDGVRAMAVRERTVAPKKIFVEAEEIDGTEDILTRHCLATIPIDNWRLGESCRILVATRNEDDTADIRDPLLSDEATAAALEASVEHKNELGKLRAREFNKEANKAKGDIERLIEKARARGKAGA